MDRLAYETVFV